MEDLKRRQGGWIVTFEVFGSSLALPLSLLAAFLIFQLFVLHLQASLLLAFEPLGSTSELLIDLRSLKHHRFSLKIIMLLENQGFRS